MPFEPLSNLKSHDIYIEQGAARLFQAECFEQYCEPTIKQNKLSIIEQQIHKKTAAYIKTNLNQTFLIERLAEQHKINSNRLNWIYKQHTGNSVADFIRNERLIAAHKLLLETTQPIKHVALQVGYQHVGNFSRAYKKKFGEAPSRTQQ